MLASSLVNGDTTHARAPRLLIVSLHYAPERTGNAPYVSSLASALSRRGYEVEVLTTHQHYPERKFVSRHPRWRQEESLDGVRVVRLRHFLGSGTAMSRACSELSFGVRASLARAMKSDAVVLVSPGMLSSAVAAMRWRRIRKYLWIQDIYTLGLRETNQAPRAFARILEMIERRLVTAATKTWVIHDRFERYLVDQMGASKGSVEIVRNWTHLPPAPTTDRQHDRLQLRWRDDEIIALHAGNQGIKQGLQNVIEAARLAQDRRLRLRFVLLGTGNQNRSLISMSRGLSNVTFLDSLPDAEYQQAMRAADVLLVNEAPGVNGMSVPSKLTSYFTTGRPTVAATDSSSVTAEEVRNARAGVVVPSASPEALIEAIESLARDPAQGKEMGLRAQDFVRRELDMDAAVLKIQESLEGSLA